MKQYDTNTTEHFKVPSLLLMERAALAVFDEINAIANGESFHPVDGNGEKSENQFVRMDKDGKAYYAVFNYMDQELQMTTALERLGLDSSKEYRLKELWSGIESTAKTNLEVTVPACDVVIFKVEE